MRKNYFRSFLFSSIVMLGITSIHAQEKEQLIKEKIAGSNGNPTLIVFSKSSSYNLNQSKQVLKEQLSLSQYDDFRKIKSENDKLGFIHEKNQQYYRGVKVEFGTYTLHSKKGKIESMSGDFYETNNVKITPRLSKGQAFQAALSHVGAQAYLWEDIAASKELGYKKPEGELVLLPIFDNLKKKGAVEKLKLAYKFEIFTIRPMGGADVYVDAQTGKVLFSNLRVKHVDNFGYDGRKFAANTPNNNAGKKMIKEFSTAMVAGSAQTRYSGTRSIETTASGGNFTLNDATRKVFTRNANNIAPVGNSLPYITNYTEFTDNDNNWTAAEYDNANKDNAALDAHWGAMMTYDYWQNVHGRNSYDNNGSQLRSYVHVDNNYDNAFWFLSVMSYGDGSSNGNEGNGFFDALTSLDVAAHEIGHAITETTANLVYQKESGAMNEGFSDIWGASVEHFAKGNGNDASPDPSIWLIGDEIDRRSGSAALRSMSDPKSLGQPDTYLGTNWVSVVGCTPSNNNDQCGVHTNSGVLNHWFYLLTVGGSGTNDVGGSYNVSGIGMTKAGNIAYRLESVYLSANATYADARTNAIQSAIDLHGAGSAEEIAVTNAWHAVGVGNAFGGGGGGGTTYCNSASTNVNDEYIGRVQLNTIDNASGAQFYTDFTAVSTDLSKNTQYTITVTPTWTGTIYNEGYAVWIDYNQNGSFTDAGEQVFSKAASKTTPVSGSFTVPTSAVNGATRMRVSLKYNGIPTSCETFTYGEVEDYTINIGTGGGGDTQAPTAPTSLVSSNITDTTATLSWTASTDNVGVTGYDVFQGTTNIGTVTGTTTNITALTPNTSYTFTVKAKDAAGNISAASNAVTFTTTSTVDTQAPSAPSSLASSNVTQTTVDLSWSASTDNVGVTGYDVYQGGSVIATVTATNYQVTGLTASTAYAFSVKAKDAAGNVSNASNTANVTTLAPPDTQAPSAPSSLTSSNITQSGVDLAWTASTDNVGVTGYDVYQGGSVIATVTATNYQVTGLAASTAYSFSVKAKDAAGNVSNASNTVNVTTLVNNITYCTSGGTNVNFEYIDLVSIGGINNVTGANGGYGDFTNLVGGLPYGSNTIVVSAGFSSTTYTESWRVWIDFNQNGTFETSERVVNGSSSNGGNLSNTFTVPTSALAGNTRMRVSMKWNGAATACQTFTYGEVEDYTVNVGSATGIVAGFGSSAVQIDGELGNEAPIFNANIYPNPTSSTLTIQLRDNRDASFKIISMIGQIVKQGKIDGNSINVSNLQSGMYFVEINDGQKSITSKIIKN